MLYTNGTRLSSSCCSTLLRMNLLALACKQEAALARAQQAEPLGGRRTGCSRAPEEHVESRGWTRLGGDALRRRPALARRPCTRRRHIQGRGGRRYARACGRVAVADIIDWETRWHRDHNHDFDNVPLQLVRIANATLQFDWLIVSDGIPAWTSAAQAALSHDPQRLLFLGHQCETDSSACKHGRAAPAATGAGPRRQARLLRAFLTYNQLLPRRHQYVLSRALLHSISASQWAACERASGATAAM